MDKKWRGRYTIEATMVLFILLGIIFLMLSVGVLWYDRCIIEGNAAVYAITEKEQELPGILFFDERNMLEQRQDKVLYSVTVPSPIGSLWTIHGEKEALYEGDLEILRKWKYIEEKQNENKQG